MQMQGLQVAGVSGQEAMQGFIKIIMQVQQHLHRLPAASGGGGNMQQEVQLPRPTTRAEVNLLRLN
jgi:hypothetical protein